jgi:hypothetical protein
MNMIAKTVKKILRFFLLSGNMKKSQRSSALIVTATTYIKKLPVFLLKQARNHKHSAKVQKSISYFAL